MDLKAFKRKIDLKISKSIFGTSFLQKLPCSADYFFIMNKFQNFDNKNEIVAASDAFFPFVDGIEALVQSGVSAIIQPSGSIRDKEIIKFANETDTVLVVSKTRHFRH